jgi:hypothetical protein
MDDFDQDPGLDDYDAPTAATVVVVAPSPSVAATPSPAAAPAAAPSAPRAPAAAELIPGVELRRGAEQPMADIDTMALADLLEPSRLTEYLTRTVGEHQAVVDVDAAPGQAIKAMMRQALLLVLANQKITGKSVGVAGQLEAFEPKLEAYLFGGDGSVVGRLQTAVGTIVPAARKVLEDILVEVDRFVFKLVKAHVDSAVDGHELMERRREAERLTSERDVARAGQRNANDRLAEYKELAAGQLADAKKAGARLAWMAGGFGTVAGALMAFAIVHFAR